MKIVRVQKCVLRSSFRQIRGQNWNGSHYYNQSHFLKAKFNYRINGDILINTLNEFTLSLFYVTGEFLCCTYKVQKYKRDCYIAIFAFSFYTQKKARQKNVARGYFAHFILKVSSLIILYSSFGPSRFRNFPWKEVQFCDRLSAVFFFSLKLSWSMRYETIRRDLSRMNQVLHDFANYFVILECLETIERLSYRDQHFGTQE